LKKATHEEVPERLAVCVPLHVVPRWGTREREEQGETVGVGGTVGVEMRGVRGSTAWGNGAAG